MISIISELKSSKCSMKILRTIKCAKTTMTYKRKIQTEIAKFNPSNSYLNDCSKLYLLITKNFVFHWRCILIYRPLPYSLKSLTIAKINGANHYIYWFYTIASARCHIIKLRVIPFIIIGDVYPFIVDCSFKPLEWSTYLINISGRSVLYNAARYKKVILKQK